MSLVAIDQLRPAGFFGGGNCQHIVNSISTAAGLAWANTPYNVFCNTNAVGTACSGINRIGMGRRGWSRIRAHERLDLIATCCGSIIRHNDR